MTPRSDVGGPQGDGGRGILRAGRPGTAVFVGGGAFKVGLSLVRVDVGMMLDSEEARRWNRLFSCLIIR